MQYLNSLKIYFKSAQVQVKCFIIGILIGKILLPLPLYWDKLADLDWDASCTDEPYEVGIGHVRAEGRKYFQLLDLSELSKPHEQLIEAFMMYGCDQGGYPVRYGLVFKRLILAAIGRPFH